MLDDSRTLFVQYNAVAPGIDGTADEILARVKQGGVDRVVVDLRNNGGGDNTTYLHLLTVLQDPAIDRPSRFTVLIGRLTFSAGANFGTVLEGTTHASFAGEAMGGSPNGYGDALSLSLPYGGVSYDVATRYWQMSTADDTRITIEPDLAIPLSSEDYLQGRDPVLDSVIAGTPVGDVRGAILGS
jgi:C-terminal processing protease CtpA/Prc